MRRCSQRDLRLLVTHGDKSQRRRRRRFFV